MKHVAVCKEPVDLVITMDASGSITQEHFYKYLEFLVDVIDDLPVGSGTRIGLQTFSGNEDVILNLNVSKTASPTHPFLALPPSPLFFPVGSGTCIGLQTFLGK